MSAVKSKNHRAGGKFAGSHTTLTDLAVIVADIAVAVPQVKKIAISIINNKLPPAHGNTWVKIWDAEGEEKYVLLVVRDNSCRQDLHVYVTNRQAAKLAIARALRDKGIRIAFTKKEKE